MLFTPQYVRVHVCVRDPDDPSNITGEDKLDFRVGLWTPHELDHDILGVVEKELAEYGYDTNDVDSVGVIYIVDEWLLKVAIGVTRDDCISLSVGSLYYEIENSTELTFYTLTSNDCRDLLDENIQQIYDHIKSLYKKNGNV